MKILCCLNTLFLFILLGSWGNVVIATSLDDHAHTHHSEISDDKAFLLEMIPHHQEAVETSAYLMTRTTRPEIRQFVEAVIAVQTAEIDQMKEWFRTWFLMDYVDQQQYQPMMRPLTDKTGGVLDQQYMEDMILHHQGAIEMAQSVLKVTERPALRAFAERIIATQNEEIESLRRWLEDTSEGNLSPTNLHAH